MARSTGPSALLLASAAILCASDATPQTAGATHDVATLPIHWLPPDLVSIEVAEGASLRVLADPTRRHGAARLQFGHLRDARVTVAARAGQVDATLPGHAFGSSLRGVRAGVGLSRLGPGGRLDVHLDWFDVQGAGDGGVSEPETPLRAQRGWMLEMRRRLGGLRRR